jgi:hypothetical protein
MCKRLLGTGETLGVRAPASRIRGPARAVQTRASMGKFSPILLAFLLVGCSYRWMANEEQDDVAVRDGTAADKESASEELVADAPAGSPLPLPAPGAGKPAEPASTSSATPPPPPPPPVIAPCQGDGEAEPNDDNAKFIGPNTCGTIAAGDVDRFFFEVNEGNTFSLTLTGDAALRMEVDAPCIDSETVSGPVGKVRIAAERDCTIRVTIKSSNSTLTGWHLRRDR